MNTYKFSLHDYHAIKQADIVVGGITVLSGENGAGKSTISQWLYHYVNASNNFETDLNQKFIDWCHEDIQQQNRVLRSFFLLIKRVHRPMPYPFMSTDSDMKELAESYMETVRVFCARINSGLGGNRIPAGGLEWLRTTLAIPDEIDADGISDEILRRKSEACNAELAAIRRKQREYKLADLKDLIAECPNFKIQWPKSMQLTENGLPLISASTFRPPFDIARAIYIDTPMFLTFGEVSKNEHWERLINMMTEPLRPMPATARKSLARIKRIIGGSVVAITDDFTSDQNLRYMRNADKLDIPIEETATGIKSFAYLERLIENGYIDSNTLLMIDEPEAHLHPQWIVEFARVLVMLNKETGVRIMVASHNPDMVAAIQAIARKEELESSTRFYLGRRTSGTESPSYVYEDLGMDIEPIFESFNIAISRIRDYGGI